MRGEQLDGDEEIQDVVEAPKVLSGPLRDTVQPVVGGVAVDIQCLAAAFALRLALA